MLDSLIGYPFLFAAVMPLISALLLKLAEKNLPQPAAHADTQHQTSGLGWVVDLTQVVAVSFLPVVTLLFAVPVSVWSLVALGAETIFVVVALVLMLNDGPDEYQKRKWLGVSPITSAGLVLNGVIGLAIIIRFS
jgi:hypothetical protein